MIHSRSNADPDVVRSTQDYRAQYPDPLRVAAGAVVQVGREDEEYPGWRWCTATDGRQGWVPCYNERGPAGLGSGDTLRTRRYLTSSNASAHAATNQPCHAKSAG